MKRLFRWFVLGFVWLGSTILGATAAALRTDPGRRAVVQTAQAAVNNAIRGSLQIDSVGGTFSSGLEIWNAEIRDPDGMQFVVVPHLQLEYDLGTLLSGRFVLGELSIEGLVVDLIQLEREGPFNVDIVFARDTLLPERPAERRKPYLAFRDVRIANATVNIRTPADPSENLVEGERRPTGYYRVRRVDGINAVFPFVRLVSPVRGEDPIAVDIDALAAHVNDPAFQLVLAQGSAEIWGDSLALTLREIAFPESDASMSGALFWPTGPLQFDLRIDADHVFTNDLTGLVGEIPRGLEGHANVTVRSLSEDVLVMRAGNMELAGRGGGGRVSGTLSMQFWTDTWAQRHTDLTLDDFDLEYVRHLLDTLPIAGRVTGRIATDGRRDSLMLDIDATFRDSLVGQWPRSYVRGRGTVSLGVPGDVVFREYALDTVDVSLETVRRLIPAIQLVGRLRGRGVVDGPWLEARYEGRMRHRDGSWPETVADGSIRFDATGEVVGVWGELVFDSLRLAGLHTSYPGLTATASLAGPLAVDGYLDSIRIDARFGSPSGALEFRGPFVFDGDRSGAHHFEVVAQVLDASAYHPGLPPTRIDGRLTGRGWRSDTGASFLETRLDLGLSDLDGVVVDSITGAVAIRDSSIVVDELDVWRGASRLTATGALGMAQPRRERLRFSLNLERLSVVEPWAARILEPLDSGVTPDGRLHATGELNGATDAFVLLADVQGFDIRRGAVRMSHLGGSGTWASASRAVRLSATIDSLFLGALAFDRPSFTIQGRPDSLRWRGRMGIQGRTTWIGGGQWVRDSVAMRFDVDSLRAVLHEGHWSADPFAVTIADSAIVFEGFEARNDSGAGHILIDGEVPVAGEGLLEGSVVGLPIADVWALAGRNPDHVSGQMGGTFSITGTARNPIIGASVSIVNAQFNDFNAPQMSGEFRHRDRRVTGDVNLFRRGDPILQVAVDLPYDLGIGRVGQRRISGPLSISARADSVDLSFFDAISPAVRRTEGTFDADLGITGTWERPELTGSMTVDNGAANFPSLGVRYHNINGRVELSADTIYIRALTMESGGGSATVGGFVRLQELSKPILALTIRTADFDAVDIAGFLSLTTAGEVRLDGPVFNATMTGRGTATRGVFYFADLITKEVVNLEDSLFQGLVDTALLQEEGLGAAFENRFLDSLRIDSLGLSIGSEVWLRSGEANIQLTGALVVNKTHREYRLTGELQTPRGSYRLEVLPAVTREFTVTRGTVRYFGTPDLNADLDIDARHIVRTRGREENVDVFINIGGTVYEPRLTLTSDVNPPLSDDEIMAYLLFGGAALDPSETRTAEFAAERVSQVVSGQIENLVISSMDVPLDYFQIRPAARGGLLGGAEIALGKQFTVLGTSAFLTATPRFCPRLQDKPVDIGGSLEFRLSRRWLLQAQAEPRRSCDAFTTESTGTFEYQFGLDLIWELSY